METDSSLNTPLFPSLLRGGKGRIVSFSLISISGINVSSLKYYVV